MSKRKKKTPVYLSSLSNLDREFVEAWLANPPERQLKLKRLVNVLDRAIKSGDEFTVKRWDKVCRGQTDIDYLLAELERRPPAS